MKEKRVTKKAILASLLSVAVCTSMLIGTSYAWFTDSVASTGNVIKSGTLDIELEVKDDQGEWKAVSGPIYTEQILWEPGYTSWENVRVYNKGTLALKYTLKFDGADLATSELANVIDVYYAPSNEVKPEERPDLNTLAAYKKGTLAEVFNGTVDAIDGHLAAGQGADQAQYATVVLHMQEDAGNEYQNKTLGAFSLTVVATQDTVERDSFDELYDKDAVYPVVSSAALGTALGNAQPGDVVPVAAGNYELPQNGASGVTIDGNDGTVIDTVNNSGANTGTLDNMTFNNIDFASSSTNNYSAGWGGDWDGIISHKTTLKDSTFNDCDFTADADDNGRVNAIYGGVADGTNVFENCKIDADVYGVNFSYVNGTLIFRNCDITGWNSFGGSKNGGESKVIFENCTFHKSENYGTLRFYQDAEVTNCTFADDFDYIDCNASGKTITISGCTGITTDKIFNNNANTNTWILNGVDVSAQVTNH